MLVALAIMAVIVVASIASLPQFLGARSLDAAVSDTISLLEEARQLTLASKDPNTTDANVVGSQYGVYFDYTATPPRAYLYKGASCVPATSCDISRTLFYRGVTLVPNFINTSGLNSVVFERLTGKTNNSGTIAITHTKTNTVKTITVTKQGTVAN